MLVMTSRVVFFLRHNTPTHDRFPRDYLVKCMRYCKVSLIKVSKLPLPTTVVLNHINIIILRSETSVAF
jgi:hypothetical protein